MKCLSGEYNSPNYTCFVLPVSLSLRYALNIVDIASRCKGSYQLTTKNSKEVAQAFQLMYTNTLLTYPNALIIGDGKEFYGETTKLMGKHDVIIQRGD